MKKRLFEVVRASKVLFHVWGPNHCGMENHLKGGCIEMKYRVALSATGALDEKGFLIDNMFIHAFMGRRAEQGSELSCELLLEDLAHELYREMCAAEPSLEVVSLVVSLSPDFGPDDEATMTCYFEGEELEKLDPRSTPQTQVQASPEFSDTYDHWQKGYDIDPVTKESVTCVERD